MCRNKVSSIPSFSFQFIITHSSNKSLTNYFEKMHLFDVGTSSASRPASRSRRCAARPASSAARSSDRSCRRAASSSTWELKGEMTARDRTIRTIPVGVRSEFLESKENHEKLLHRSSMRPKIQTLSKFRNVR